MIHNIDAIDDHGVFRPVQPLALPEGTPVHLRVEEEKTTVETEAIPAEGEIPSLLERMKGFVGTVHDLPEDASVNLDHYLYGTPKRCELHAE
jgi:predicted DNA-binding antitoxin AbrB/MazE fold protein